MKKFVCMLLAATMLAITLTVTSCNEEPASPPPHTHAYGEWQTVQEPTCVAVGTEKRICSCGDTETRNTEKVEHTFADATCTAPKTCTVCELTEGDALPHTEKIVGYQKPTAITDGATGKTVCNECGATLSPSYILTSLKSYAKKNVHSVSNDNAYTCSYNLSALNPTYSNTDAFVIEAYESKVLVQYLHFLNENAFYSITFTLTDATPLYLQYEYYYAVKMAGTYYGDVLKGSFEVSTLYDQSQFSVTSQQSTIGDISSRLEQHKTNACDLAQQLAKFLNEFLDRAGLDYSADVFGFDLEDISNH
ncbi:MAG: hypothetical protein IKM08_08865 [Clostridia bacterium]|nr:hypothetical protein [Clostridia bacterium]